MINYTEHNKSFDVGSGRDYREAILNILIQLRPRFCLEVGTHIYQTSKTFSYYFEKYKEEPFDDQYQLITTDIGEFTRDKEPPPRVYPLMVYPYTKDVAKKFMVGLKVFTMMIGEKLSLMNIWPIL